MIVAVLYLAVRRSKTLCVTRLLAKISPIFTATEESYLLYLRKQEEAGISEALDRRRIINVAVAEAAGVPSLPSNHRLLTVLVGLLLAILTSVELAFVSEHLDPRFRTPAQVRSFLSIPVLAAMPQNGMNGKNGKNDVHGKNGPGVAAHVP